MLNGRGVRKGVKMGYYSESNLPVRHSFVAIYTQWVKRNAFRIFFISLLTGIIGAFYSGLLYKNLKTDIEELLPASAQSVKDLKQVLNRVGGFNHISVVIESSDVQAGERFQKEVADALRQLPSSLVSRVQYSLDEEMGFFTENRFLYIDLQDWNQIERYIRERIRFEWRKKLMSEGALPPQFSFADLEEKYRARASQVNHFKNGLFASKDERIHIVLAFLPAKVTDLEASKKLSEETRQIVAQLKPSSYAADMKVGFSGDVQLLVEEHEGLIEDLVLSSVLVSLLVVLILYFFFKSWPGVIALNTCLFIGVAWTFGLSYFLVGYLNANTAFLGSIVIGNGINFGIILLARYLEERRQNQSVETALFKSIQYTAQSTWVAALAAGLAYGSLMLTSFRGFNQFGIIGALGMVLCWIAAFTVFPAILCILESKQWLRLKTAKESFSFFKFFSRFVFKHHRSLALGSVALTIVAILGYPRLSSKTLETDFSKLRNKTSIQKGAGYWSQKVDSVFERYLTPTVILTQFEKDTPLLYKKINEMHLALGENSPISSLKRVEDFLPNEQFLKIRRIEKIHQHLPEALLRRLSEQDQKRVRAFLPPVGQYKTLAAGDLPRSIQTGFREQDGSFGRMIHVYPKLEFWNGEEIIRFTEILRDAIKRSGVPAAIAGQPPLSADMIASITKDGPRATGFALVGVILLVLFLFPRWALFRSILGALLLGVCLMVGAMAWLDLKINFLNFIALPITFGIGVDYAVNLLSRYRNSSLDFPIQSVLQHTGGAVALCSLTTIIGYSSLLIAGSQAFVSFGALAVLGELTCLFAALVTMPAFWIWSQRKKYQAMERNVQATENVMFH